MTQETGGDEVTCMGRIAMEMQGRRKCRGGEEQVRGEKGEEAQRLRG